MLKTFKTLISRQSDKKGTEQQTSNSEEKLSQLLSLLFEQDFGSSLQKVNSSTVKQISQALEEIFNLIDKFPEHYWRDNVVKAKLCLKAFSKVYCNSNLAKKSFSRSFNFLEKLIVDKEHITFSPLTWILTSLTLNSVDEDSFTILTSVLMEKQGFYDKAVNFITSCAKKGTWNSSLKTFTIPENLKQANFDDISVDVLYPLSLLLVHISWILKHHASFVSSASTLQSKLRALLTQSQAVEALFLLARAQDVCLSVPVICILQHLLLTSERAICEQIQAIALSSGALLWAYHQLVHALLQPPPTHTATDSDKENATVSLAGKTSVSERGGLPEGGSSSLYPTPSAASIPTPSSSNTATTHSVEVPPAGPLSRHVSMASGSFNFGRQRQSPYESTGNLHSGSSRVPVVYPKYIREIFSTSVLPVVSPEYLRDCCVRVPDTPYDAAVVLCLLLSIGNGENVSMLLRPLPNPLPAFLLTSTLPVGSSYHSIWEVLAARAAPLPEMLVKYCDKMDQSLHWDIWLAALTFRVDSPRFVWGRSALEHLYFELGCALESYDYVRPLRNESWDPKLLDITYPALDALIPVGGIYLRLLLQDLEMDYASSGDIQGGSLGREGAVYFDGNDAAVVTRHTSDRALVSAAVLDETQMDGEEEHVLVCLRILTLLMLRWPDQCRDGLPLGTLLTTLKLGMRRCELSFPPPPHPTSKRIVTNDGLKLVEPNIRTVSNGSMLTIISWQLSALWVQRCVILLRHRLGVGSRTSAPRRDDIHYFSCIGGVDILVEALATPGVVAALSEGRLKGSERDFVEDEEEESSSCGGGGNVLHMCWKFLFELLTILPSCCTIILNETKRDVNFSRLVQGLSLLIFGVGGQYGAPLSIGAIDNSCAILRRLITADPYSLVKCVTDIAPHLVLILLAGHSPVAEPQNGGSATRGRNDTNDENSTSRIIGESSATLLLELVRLEQKFVDDEVPTLHSQQGLLKETETRNSLTPLTDLVVSVLPPQMLRLLLSLTPNAFRRICCCNDNTVVSGQSDHRKSSRIKVVPKKEFRTVSYLAPDLIWNPHLRDMSVKLVVNGLENAGVKHHLRYKPDTPNSSTQNQKNENYSKEPQLLGVYLKILAFPHLCETAASSTSSTSSYLFTAPIDPSRLITALVTEISVSDKGRSTLSPKHTSKKRLSPRRIQRHLDGMEGPYDVDDEAEEDEEEDVETDGTTTEYTFPATSGTVSTYKRVVYRVPAFCTDIKYSHFDDSQSDTMESEGNNWGNSFTSNISGHPILARDLLCFLGLSVLRTRWTDASVGGRSKPSRGLFTKVVSVVTKYLTTAYMKALWRVVKDLRNASDRSGRKLGQEEVTRASTDESDDFLDASEESDGKLSSPDSGESLGAETGDSGEELSDRRPKDNRSEEGKDLSKQALVPPLLAVDTAILSVESIRTATASLLALSAWMVDFPAADISVASDGGYGLESDSVPSKLFMQAFLAVVDLTSACTAFLHLTKESVTENGLRAELGTQLTACTVIIAQSAEKVYTSYVHEMEKILRAKAHEEKFSGSRSSSVEPQSKLFSESDATDDRMDEERRKRWSGSIQGKSLSRSSSGPVVDSETVPSPLYLPSSELFNLLRSSQCQLALVSCCQSEVAANHPKATLCALITLQMILGLVLQARKKGILPASLTGVHENYELCSLGLPITLLDTLLDIPFVPGKGVWVSHPVSSESLHENDSLGENSSRSFVSDTRHNGSDSTSLRSVCQQTLENIQVQLHSSEFSSDQFPVGNTSDSLRDLVPMECVKMLRLLVCGLGPYTGLQLSSLEGPLPQIMQSLLTPALLHTILTEPMTGLQFLQTKSTIRRPIAMWSPQMRKILSVAVKAEREMIHVTKIKLEKKKLLGVESVDDVENGILGTIWDMNEVNSSGRFVGLYPQHVDEIVIDGVYIALLLEPQHRDDLGIRNLPRFVEALQASLSSSKKILEHLRASSRPVGKDIMQMTTQIAVKQKVLETIVSRHPELGFTDLNVDDDF